MRNYIKLRIIDEASLLCKNNYTIRELSKKYNLSKSTIYNDLSKKLKLIDYELYKKVNNIFISHNLNKHLKGGLVTKEKYEKNK